MKYIISRRPLLAEVIIIKRKIKKAVLVLHKIKMKGITRARIKYGIPTSATSENAHRDEGYTLQGKIRAGVTSDCRMTSNLPPGPAEEITASSWRIPVAPK